jgi:polysaccharide export outer membrane protein
MNYKKRKLSRVFNVLVLLVLVTATSCVSNKKMLYFQDVEGQEVASKLLNFEPKIQQGDLLNVNVAAIDAEAALPFNLYETPVVGTYTSNLNPLEYLVDTDGNINFPVLGILKVEGLSTKEFSKSLTEKLANYIKAPIVNVRLTNFKITVLGEVLRPGSFDIPNERVTILEAIGLAGDLTIQGKRNTVSLIREVQGERTFVTIDLTNKKLFDSPYYYLAQNDVIYVEPNKTKVNSSAVGSNAGLILSSISTLISLVAILTR